MKVLLIDYGGPLVKQIKAIFRRSDIACDQVPTIQRAADLLLKNVYHCLIIDADKPGILHFLRFLETDPRTGIIIMASNLDDRGLYAMELRFDEFLRKPVDSAEVCRLTRDLIWKKLFGDINEIDFHSLKVDALTLSVRIGDEPIALNGKELTMLFFLLANRNKIVPILTLSQLLVRTDVTSDPYHSIYPHLKSLRRKLNGSGFFEHLVTVRKVGYRLEG